MVNWLIAVTIGAAFGVVLGVKIARDSNAKLSVQGGAPAQLFHYLASASLSALLPYIIAGVVVGLSFLALVGTAVGFVALTGLFLLLYAAFERKTQASSAP